MDIRIHSIALKAGAQSRLSVTDAFGKKSAAGDGRTLRLIVGRVELTFAHARVCSELHTLKNRPLLKFKTGQYPLTGSDPPSPSARVRKRRHLQRAGLSPAEEAQVLGVPSSSVGVSAACCWAAATSPARLTRPGGLFAGRPLDRAPKRTTRRSYPPSAILTCSA